MDWVLLQRNLPHYQFSERHRRVIHAPPDAVWRAIHTTKVYGSLITRGAVSLRTLPARLAGRTNPQPTLFDLSGMAAFLRLGEDAERELILGMVGQFWLPRGGLMPIEPEEFVKFADPAFAKLAWGFLLTPRGTTTLLQTETRIFCPTAATTRRLRPYWLVIRPISGLIRREILAGIARGAEAEAGASAR